MADDDNANLDPRFDPAFQRGFEGTVTTTRRRSLAGAPSVLPAQQTAQPAPIAQRPAYPPAPSDLEPEDAGAPAPLESDDEPVHGRVNPFIIVLAIVAVVLIAGGGWAAEMARTVFKADSLSSNVDYVSLQIIMYAAPIGVGVGVATAVGILFFYAIAWQKRRG